MSKEKLLNRLSFLFLKYRDPDEGYCRVLRIIKRLENLGIFVDINKVQETAYKSRENLV